MRRPKEGRFKVRNKTPMIRLSKGRLDLTLKLASSTQDNSEKAPSIENDLKYIAAVHADLNGDDNTRNSIYLELAKTGYTVPVYLTKPSTPLANPKLESARRSVLRRRADLGRIRDSYEATIQALQ